MYVAALGAFALVRWHVWSYGEDTGGFTQMILNTAHGFYSRMESRSHFAAHFSPILATLWPLVALTRSGLSLQIVQVVLAALCAVPVYLIARSRASEAIALRCAILALLYPPLIGVATSDFHEVAFFPPIALFLAWAALSHRWRWFTIFALLALLIREDVCLFLLLIGLGAIVYALWPRSAARASGARASVALAGLAISLPAAALLWAYFGLVTPRLGGWPFATFYQYPFAHGPSAFVAAALQHPTVVARSVLTLGRLTYALEALAPLAFLPVRSWWSLTALPGFVEVISSSDPGVWRMGEHYAALWIPGLLLGATLALCDLERRRGDRVALRWSVAAVTISVVMLVGFNPVHPAYDVRPPYPDRHSAVLAMACVPKSASVSTHEQWFSHFAGRYSEISPNFDLTSQYFVYATDFDNPVFRAIVLPKVQSQQAAGAYAVVCQYGAVRAYRRVSRGP